MLDIKITADGELEVGTNGDFAVVSNDEAIAQRIMFLLKTTKGDCLVTPSVGCDLERFIGSPNTSETHSLIESRVTFEIQQNNILLWPTVDCIKSAENEVLILIEFDSTEDNAKVIQVVGQLDLRTGSVFARVDSRIS